MSTALTPGQHALLATELNLARQRAEQALQAQRDGQGRLEHAAALLEDDPQAHEAERELDQARSEQLLAQLAALDDALLRLQRPGYGHCTDCRATIPFDRLLHQPQALRCIGCQTRAEAGR
jgi:RNA polymerase-binding transcription factor DksA